MESRYHRSNPYHNSVHASDVVNSLAYFLQQFSNWHQFTCKEVFASLLAAAAHDVGLSKLCRPLPRVGLTKEVFCQVFFWSKCIEGCKFELTSLEGTTRAIYRHQSGKGNHFTTGKRPKAIPYLDHLDVWPTLAFSLYLWALLHLK